MRAETLPHSLRDSTWSSMRNTITPLYQPARLAALIPTVQSYVRALGGSISAAQREQPFVPFSDLALRMAIDVIGATAFGVDFALSAAQPQPEAGGDTHFAADLLSECEESMPYLRMDLSTSLSTVLGLVAPALQIPLKHFLERLPGTRDRAIRAVEARLCRRIDALVSRRSGERERGEGSVDFLAGRLYALKVLHGTHDDAVRLRIRREIEILRTTDDLVVVRCHAMCDRAGEIEILLEYMDGGSLEGRRIASEPLLADVARQVLGGIAYLRHQALEPPRVRPAPSKREDEREKENRRGRKIFQDLVKISLGPDLRRCLPITEAR